MGGKGGIGQDAGRLVKVGRWVVCVTSRWERVFIKVAVDIHDVLYENFLPYCRRYKIWIQKSLLNYIKESKV